MFDDLLSATALIGVAGVLAAAVTSLATEPSGPRVAAATPAATATSAADTRVMPIYDLPRVVVTGQRLRDGDMLADGRELPRPATVPR